MASESEAERWGRMKSVLGDVLLLDEPQRSGRLLELAAEHPDLREDLEGMLGAEQQAQGFLAGSAHGVSVEPVPMPTTGTRIGSYKLKSILGIGGSSMVYQAQQDEPRRDVALKVLLDGTPSPGALQRFALEAELLAGLQHPAIAQVYEAGTSDQGRPWIAMELVPGAVTLTDYAKRHGLDRAARVALLGSVCAAISHGHRSGVIHRDIKPANVLVDEHGRARVIDFGVAKLQGLRAGASPTLPGSFLGTLAYMSPEQARGQERRIDTRSDVYSLGVLAYELLCGELPYDLVDMSLGQALDYLRHPTPRRPRECGVTGDMEAVLLHALEVDPDRRYASAEDLAEDLAHSLAGEPVRARPPSLPYFVRCFVGRHRLQVMGAALLMLALVGGGIGFSMQTARVEARERARAEQVKDFLLSVLELAGPKALADGDWPLSTLLEDAGRRIDQELSDNSGAAFEVHATIGKAWRDLGRYDRAEGHFLRALELAADTWGAGSMDVGNATNALADVLLEAGKYSEARQRLVQGLELFAALENSRISRAINTRKLAEAYLGEGLLEDAEQAARKALGEYLQLFGGEGEPSARGRQTLGRVLLAKGAGQAGLEELAYALASDENRHGAESLATARMRLEYSAGLRAVGDLTQAALEKERAMAVLATALPANHPLLQGR
ncbi:MAG: tetratricopeptide (TPR) repeat protein [Planctomycetota bacterium]|jgi:tetratricopeptide (TPR) repeat protein